MHHLGPYLVIDIHHHPKQWIFFCIHENNDVYCKIQDIGSSITTEPLSWRTEPIEEENPYYVINLSTQRIHCYLRTTTYFAEIPLEKFGDCYEANRVNQLSYQKDGIIYAKKNIRAGALGITKETFPQISEEEFTHYASLKPPVYETSEKWLEHTNVSPEKLKEILNISECTFISEKDLNAPPSKHGQMYVWEIKHSPTTSTWCYQVNFLGNILSGEFDPVQNADAFTFLKNPKELSSDIRMKLSRVYLKLSPIEQMITIEIIKDLWPLKEGIYSEDAIKICHALLASKMLTSNQIENADILNECNSRIQTFRSDILSPSKIHHFFRPSAHKTIGEVTTYIYKMIQAACYVLGELSIPPIPRLPLCADWICGSNSSNDFHDHQVSLIYNGLNEAESLLFRLIYTQNLSDEHQSYSIQELSHLHAEISNIYATPIPHEYQSLANDLLAAFSLSYRAAYALTKIEQNCIASRKKIFDLILKKLKTIDKAHFKETILGIPKQLREEFRIFFDLLLMWGHDYVSTETLENMTIMAHELQSKKSNEAYLMHIFYLLSSIGALSPQYVQMTTNCCDLKFTSELLSFLLNEKKQLTEPLIKTILTGKISKNLLDMCALIQPYQLLSQTFLEQLGAQENLDHFSKTLSHLFHYRLLTSVNIRSYLDFLIKQPVEYLTSFSDIMSIFQNHHLFSTSNIEAYIKLLFEKGDAGSTLNAIQELENQNILERDDAEFLIEVVTAHANPMKASCAITALQLEGHLNDSQYRLYYETIRTLEQPQLVIDVLNTIKKIQTDNKELLESFIVKALKHSKPLNYAKAVLLLWQNHLLDYENALGCAASPYNMAHGLIHFAEKKLLEEKECVHYIHFIQNHLKSDKSAKGIVILLKHNLYYHSKIQVKKEKIFEKDNPEKFAELLCIFKQHNLFDTLFSDAESTLHLSTNSKSTSKSSASLKSEKTEFLDLIISSDYLALFNVINTLNQKQFFETLSEEEQIDFIQKIVAYEGHSELSKMLTKLIQSELFYPEIRHQLLTDLLRHPQNIEFGYGLLALKGYGLLDNELTKAQLYQRIFDSENPRQLAESICADATQIRRERNSLPKLRRVVEEPRPQNRIIGFFSRFGSAKKPTAKIVQNEQNEPSVDRFGV